MLAGQEHMPGMVVVVVPLRSKPAVRRILASIENAGAIIIILKNEMNLASGFSGELAHGLAEFVKKRGPARLDHGVHGVEAQAIQAVMMQPMQGVVDRKPAHLRHAVVDRTAPWRLRRREEGGRIAC